LILPARQGENKRISACFSSVFRQKSRMEDHLSDVGFQSRRGTGVVGTVERVRREGSAERAWRSPQSCAAAWWVETRAEGDSGRAKAFALATP
jgi:hypothetical protein